MKNYDIAVIGGGAAGTIAAIRAGQFDKKVVLIERNPLIGKKILLTGKGRCNVTNIAPIDTFIEKFGKQGQFFRTAFFKFFNLDIIDFFAAKGLELKTERQGRVFPVTDKAASIIEILKQYLVENKIDIIYNARLKGVTAKDGSFLLETDNSDKIKAKKIILATGGASYRETGSAGDGYNIAVSLGHTVAPLKPALVPLTVKEPWIRNLQGLALENIRITFEFGDKKKTVSEIGELMFTHFGVSGPLVLDLSADVVIMLQEHKEGRLYIDLKPGLKAEQLESKLLYKFKVKGNIQLKNLLKDLLPQRLIPVFLNLLDLKWEIKTNQVTQEQRDAIIRTLKAFPLTITGSLPLEEAMVTGGGVLTSQINPRTMESKIVPGLYFAGEIIDGAAPSGGYNLQQAFSTGYLAGEGAANA